MSSGVEVFLLIAVFFISGFIFGGIGFLMGTYYIGKDLLISQKEVAEARDLLKKEKFRRLMAEKIMLQKHENQGPSFEGPNEGFDNRN